MKAAKWLSMTAALTFFASPALADIHPLDGLSADEITNIKQILLKQGTVTDKTLFPLIELQEPDKQKVHAWHKGEKIDRKAIVHFRGEDGYQQTLVNLTKGNHRKPSALPGQPMILLEEFLTAMNIALSDSEFQKKLKLRNLTPDDVFCLPLTAGNFFTDMDKGRRLMKVPCYQNPTGSNFYAKPVEGLVGVVDLSSNKLVKIIDEGVVPAPEDAWGYRENEITKRLPLRPKTNPAIISQSGKPNYKIDGAEVTWDIWKFRYRIDKRPGIVLSEIMANDQGKWRSILYQAHLSEVFVPYMDPAEGWYWRTYMDSGEYGFGLFLSPLRAGVDCPATATFLPATIHDDLGNPLTIPDAICIFERNIGDPAWRHFEVFEQSEEKFVPAEGRPETELVIRTASEVGNYDYLVDYRFKQDGQIYIKVGASGLDAVKGVASTNLSDPTIKEDTQYGRLIAPNLVAPYHDHYFNFKLDFDIDSPENTFMVSDIVAKPTPENSPRRSIWGLDSRPVKSEMEGRFKLSSMKPKMFHLMNMNKKGNLGYNPGYMIHHGSVAYGPFDFANDPPFKRNRYIEYSIWNTLYDPKQRYAGGDFAFASDGSDTLAEWVKEDRNLMNKDIVTWFTAGFHHIPRMEDWPVMSTEWKTIHMIPMNFFPHNPALTIRTPENNKK